MNVRMRRVAVSALGAAVLFGAAACGGSKDDASPTQPSAAPATAPSSASTSGKPAPSSKVTTAPDAVKKSAEAKRKLDDCLKRAGVRPIPPSGRPLSDKESAAARKCAGELLRSIGTK
ncbi:hypothetical protein [Actinomadura gamaensis]|uniref:Uncharacterized protein n=1 Tax=Actinomadura gamaensis TaxID=1763541 RepID=A0ABV9U347_9ACTN